MAVIGVALALAIKVRIFRGALDQIPRSGRVAVQRLPLLIQHRQRSGRQQPGRLGRERPAPSRPLGRRRPALRRGVARHRRTGLRQPEATMASTLLNGSEPILRDRRCSAPSQARDPWPPMACVPLRGCRDWGTNAPGPDEGPRHGCGPDRHGEAAAAPGITVTWP
jgi:hypothetical protein